MASVKAERLFFRLSAMPKNSAICGIARSQHIFANFSGIRNHMQNYLTRWSVTQVGLIHEKNRWSKISWDFPFKNELSMSQCVLIIVIAALSVYAGIIDTGTVFLILIHKASKLKKYIKKIFFMLQEQKSIIVKRCFIFTHYYSHNVYSEKSKFKFRS
jgi:hypothetical protein